MPVFTKDDRNVLFIHIPKTGGSAVEEHFKAAGWRMSYGDGRTGPGSANYLRRCSPQHMHGVLLRNMFRMDRFDAVFTVVREPLARFRSEYVMRHPRDLSTSVEAVEKWADKTLARYDRDPFVYDNHVRPQVEFLVKGLQVYRLEDGLDTALGDLDTRFGLDIPTEVERVRSSEKTRGISSQDVEISPALEQRLQVFYAQDFRQLGYGDVPKERVRPTVLARAALRASRGLSKLAKRL